MRASRRNYPSYFSLFLCVSVATFSACSTGEDSERTKEDRTNSAHYYNSLRDNKEASRLAVRAGNSFSQKQRGEIRALTASALTEARMVADQWLDNAHPELKKHYRSQFQAALELALANLDNPNYEAAKKGSVLFSNYSDWIASHQEEIHFPR